VRHHYLVYVLGVARPTPDPTAGSGSEATAAATAVDAASRTVVAITGSTLLPSCSLVPHNPGMAAELWALLRLLPFGTRYRLYALLKVGRWFFWFVSISFLRGGHAGVGIGWCVCRAGGQVW
jgi:hypothetical protein